MTVPTDGFPFSVGCRNKIPLAEIIMAETTVFLGDLMTVVVIKTDLKILP